MALHHNLPLPEIDSSNRPFWDGAREGRLVLLKCEECGRFRYPPVPACKKCLSMNSTWSKVSGRGSIWSWVVYHRAYFPGAEVPYVVALVQLEEGTLLATNLVGLNGRKPRIGAPVEVAFQEVQDVVLPLFRML